jgi:hypothetical protein
VLGSFTDCRSRPSGGAFVTRSLPFIFSSAATFESRGFQSLEGYNAMNWRKFVLLGCVVACVFATSTATAQMRGHGNTPRSIARMPMHRAPMPGSMGRMPMHRAPMMNSALGLRRFNRFNYKDFNRANRFHRFKHFNQIIFIGNFASPWWWGPWWSWNWVYPYGSYAYPYPSDYSDYGYGYGNYGYSYGYGSSGYDYGYVSPPLRYYGRFGENCSADSPERIATTVSVSLCTRRKS